MGATFPIETAVNTMTKYCQLNQIMRGLEIQEKGMGISKMSESSLGINITTSDGIISNFDPGWAA